jgi:Flp pilus assembly protein TadG
MRSLTKSISVMRSDNRGVSAIEFSLFAGMLSFAVINTAEISIYIYKRLQLDNATQMGAQAAWQTCDKKHLPATTNCPNLMTAISYAVKSTSLGTQVTIQAGSPSEGYYCLTAAGVLQYVSSVTSKPSDCSATGMANLQPADYIQITTAFQYAPLFPGVSVASLFTTPITKTAWMRLN